MLYLFDFNLGFVQLVLVRLNANLQYLLLFCKLLVGRFVFVNRSDLSLRHGIILLQNHLQLFHFGLTFITLLLGQLLMLPRQFNEFICFG
jgi:hypothetical protein